MKTSISKFQKIMMLTIKIAAPVITLIAYIFFMSGVRLEGSYEVIYLVASIIFVVALFTVLFLYAKNKIFFILAIALDLIYLLSVIISFHSDVNSGLAFAMLVMFSSPFLSLMALYGIIFGIESSSFYYILDFITFLIPLLAGKFVGKNKKKE